MIGYINLFRLLKRLLETQGIYLPYNIQLLGKDVSHIRKFRAGGHNIGRGFTSPILGSQHNIYSMINWRRCVKFIAI